MRFEQFLQHAAGIPCFDLSLAERVMNQPRRQTIMQLSRWSTAGHLIPLRRGVYTVADAFRKAPFSAPQAANEIYRPSYLSGIWALGFYGIVPERVVLFTSVTTRVTRRFSNALGDFAYSNIRKDLFRNFARHTIDGTPVWIADPEKALLDYWHLHAGAWSLERMKGMRFQNFELVDISRLGEFAKGYPGRVQKALNAWMAMVEEAEAG
jgi:hypothetical protein